MKKLVYLVLMMAVFTGCFFGSTKSAAAKEKVQTVNSFSSGNGVILRDGDESTEAVPADVTKPIEKGKKLMIYLVRFIGWFFAVFGFVFLGISFFSHQMDQRITGGIAIGAGLLVAFSPEIVTWLTSK